MADTLPINIPVPQSETTVSIDFLDTITGVAYKKFYLLGTVSASGANSYSLTSDGSLTSDDENFTITGNAQDTDFDIKIGKGFSIAPEDAIIVMSRNADTGSNQTLTYTIYHVAVGGTETSIGAVTSDTISGSGGNEFHIKTQKIPMTRKKFSKGETLRLNIITSSGNFDQYYFDPSGLQVQNTESPNYPHTSFILLPIVTEY